MAQSALKEQTGKLAALSVAKSAVEEQLKKSKVGPCVVIYHYIIKYDLTNHPRLHGLGDELQPFSPT